uniref:Uncharacterized protein n=1 Tax=Romanomermis culicivorax TaxID=13658 RepID=A0A915IRI2_ROMCU
MPKWVWYNVYRLLRDAPNQRLSQHELNVEHSKRFKQSIGGKTMLAACSVKKIVELLCALPYIEPVKVNGVMNDKLDLMESKSKKVKDSSSDEEDFEPEIKLDIHDKDQKNAEDDFSLPCQPLELLPSWGVMPEALRQKIYALLMTRKFREGVELKQFRDEYTKFYSSSISNQRDCKMNADQMFYCLKDIIEIVNCVSGGCLCRLIECTSWLSVPVGRSLRMADCTLWPKCDYPIIFPVIILKFIIKA